MAAKSDTTPRVGNFSWSTNSYGGRYLQLDFSQSYTPGNVNNTITVVYSSIGGNSNYYDISNNYLDYSLDGGSTWTSVFSYGYTTWGSQVFPAKKGSITKTFKIPHNNDGTKTIKIHYHCNFIYQSGQGAQDLNCEWTLDTIPMYSNFTNFYIDNIQENSLKLNWSTDLKYSKIEYSIDNGTNWVTISNSAGTSGNYLYNNGVSANTTYSFLLRSTCLASSLTKITEKTVSATTYNWPSIISNNIVINYAGDSKVTYNCDLYNPLGRTINFSLKYGSESAITISPVSTSGTLANITIDKSTIESYFSNSSRLTLSSRTFTLTANYSGHTSTKTITINLNSSYYAPTPTLNPIYADGNGNTYYPSYYNAFGVFLVNKSRCKVNPNVTAGCKLSATTSSITYTLNGAAATLSNNYLDMGSTSSLLQINYSATVTDSRGFKKTVNGSIRQSSVSVPTISSFVAERDPSTTTNISMAMSWNTQKINGTAVNILSTSVSISPTGPTINYTSKGSTGTGVNFNDNNIYTLTLTVTDQLNCNTTKTVQVGRSQPFVFLDPETKGVGINCYPGNAGLEVKDSIFILDRSNTDNIKKAEIEYDETEGCIKFIFH